MSPLKTISASLAVVVLGAGLATTTATPAAADPGAVIAGVIGAAALGAIVAGAASQPHYQGAPAGYYDGQNAYGQSGYYVAPSYAQPAYEPSQAYYQGDEDYDRPAYRSHCHVRQQPVQDDWGRTVGYQPVRVCR